MVSSHLIFLFIIFVNWQKEITDKPRQEQILTTGDVV